MNEFFAGSITNTSLPLICTLVVIVLSGYYLLIKKHPDLFRPYQILVATLIMTVGIILCIYGTSLFAFLSGVVLILIGRSLFIVPRRIM